MSTLLKNNIKEENPDYDNFDGKEVEGKIVDYQFLVRPKQEPIDTKPTPASLEFVGEIQSEEHNYHLPREIRFTTKIEDLLCKYCNYKTTCKLDYISHTNKQHQRSKYVRKKVDFACEYCDFKTHSRTSIKRHTDVHQISKENLPHGCTLCEFKCIDKSYIKKHMINVHTVRDRTFFCHICGHAATSSRNLKTHHLASHDVTRKSFDCDLCSYKANANHKLTVHKDYVHFKKPRIYKQHVCDMCGEMFTGLAKLNIHLLRKHEVDVEVKTYICYHCGKKYFKRFAFMQHVLQHSSHREKMFCANCDYSTFNKTNLSQHMVKHDKHIKMHKCNMCSFETKRAHTLRHHIKTHFNKL
ncbi:unnamed protein product [Psylliodes chrysocephalus]|uniref:C2H2-type domain-containing protein n=1 Tax=Psylliodes chrysocephalus TaxID=3402493 RepID=A0A9P0GJ31_9CUCU|nr:unnamed protein product [Psylliodes chrysocephala]